MSMDDLEFRRVRELNHKYLLGSKENATEQQDSLCLFPVQKCEVTQSPLSTDVEGRVGRRN